MLRWTCVFVWSLSACAEVDAPDARPTSTSREWVYTSQDTGAPPFDIEVFRADLVSLVAELPTLDPAPLLAAYKTARAHGDTTCPAENSLDTEDAYLTWWYGACGTSDTSNAVHFNGVMTAWAWSGQDLSQQTVYSLPYTFPPGFSWVGEGFEGRIDIYDATDTFDFSCSCAAIQVDGVTAGGDTARVAYARAPAAWEGPGPQDTWLQGEERLGSWLSTELVNAATGTHTTRVTGSITGPGERFRGINLELTAEPTVQDGTVLCSSLSGVATVWDAVADVSRSLDLVSDASAGGCIACGDVDGESACFDAAPLLLPEGA